MLRWAVSALLAAVLPGAADEARERIVLLDACDYASGEAARTAWQPIDKTTPPVDVPGAGRRMLALPCNFTTNTEWRVAWDRAGRWDLSGAGEIALDVFADAGLGAHMILHLRSGKGWYGCNFHVPAGSHAVDLPRKRFGIEGTPGGWDRIDRARLSVIRGGAVERRILVSALRAICRPAHVAVYRNDAGVGREGGVPHYARLTADALDRLGIGYELMDDRAVAAGRLRGKKVVVLPLNPVLPPPAGGEIRKFVAAGGKLLACYHLPEPLGELLGLRLGKSIEGRRSGALASIVFQGRGDRPKIHAVQHSWTARELIPAGETKVAGRWVDRSGQVTDVPAVTRNRNGYFVGHVLTRENPSAKDRLLLEMLGELWWGAWQAVYHHRLERMGQVAGLAGVKELTAAATANAAGDPVRQKKVADLLASGRRRLRDAHAVMKYGDAILASEDAAKAHDYYTRAYAVSVPSRAGEFRGVWCHSPLGVAGLSWEQAVSRLADAGFNAVIPNMCWGGGAAYPSRHLPPVADARRRGDLLAECLRAARKHGLGVHVWKVNWNLWSNAPARFVEQMRQAGRLQQTPDGKTFNWLCPSHPDNQKLELESMLEIVRRYPVAGVHFDYIRYPGLQGCYCPHCRERFEAACGVKVKDWPAEVRPGGASRGGLKERYLQFRRDNITRLVAAVSGQARKLRPGVLISAAVFWHWPSARDSVGQDWRLWVEKGYLDFVCPMQYTPDAALFDDWTGQTAGWVAGKVPLVPGIGATLGLSPAGTLRQVLIARRRGAAGFVLFNYGSALAEEHLPLLRLGATAEKTAWPPPEKAPEGR